MSEQILLGQRGYGHRSPKKSMIIVVEGASEKKYFSRFRTPDSLITIKKMIEPEDRTAIGMIKRCMEIKKSVLHTDELIAVFDADQNSLKNIEDAVEPCLKHDIRMYISNPSFEFWLLLHFEDNRSTYIQKELEKELEKQTKVKYEKSEGINKFINDEDVKDAITRSKKLLPDGDPVMCKKTLPSTCLHILVEKLIKKRQVNSKKNRT